MFELLTSLKELIYVFSKLWNVLTDRIGDLIIDNNQWSMNFRFWLFNTLPNWVKDMSLFGLFSIGFITFTILWSLMKFITKII